MGKERWTRARLAIGLLVCLVACGCAAGLIGLVAIAVSGGGGGGGGGTTPLDNVSITAITPRQSAVVGGVEVMIEGRNFDDGVAVSVGGQEAVDVEFVDDQTVHATIPFNNLGSPDVTSGDPDPADFALRYTETSPQNLRLRVTTRDHGFVDSPFWYIRPRLSEIDPSYGNLGQQRAVVVEGKYFGFSSRDSDTRAWLVYQNGNTTKRIPASSVAAVDTACVDGCPGDPNQGQLLSVILPRKTGTFADLTSGPDYFLRIVSENGVDDIELGYAPPYPPADLTCVTIQSPTVAVRLTWREDAADDPIDGEDGLPDQPFDRVIIERDGAQLATVDGGIGEYVDLDVQNRIYRYRVYGEVDGAGGESAASPAVNCTVAVIPPNVPVDLIWDLRPRLPPGPAPDGAGGDNHSEESPDLLYGAVQRHAVPFVFRGMSFSEPAGEFLRPLFDTGRIGITWITTSNQADFGELEDESFETLADYYGTGRAGGIYLEGQHVAGAIGAAPALGDLVADALGFDPLKNLRSIDRVESVTVPGSLLQGVKFSTEPGAVVGLKASNLEAEDVEIETPISITGRVPNGGGSGTVVESFVAALGSQTGRLVLSHLSLGGLDGPDTQQTIADELVDIYLRYLELGQASQGDMGMASSFSPTAGASGSTTNVLLAGTDLDLVSEVLFGTTSGAIIQRTATSLRVRTPAVAIPGSVPIILISTPDETRRVSSPGDFEFRAPAVALTGISPRSGPLGGGSEVTISGANFTPPPDLQVFFAGVPARIRAGSATTSSVTCYAPAATRGGQVTVRVQTSGGSASGTFTYSAGPVIEQIDPPCCTSPGEPTAIAIRGNGFTGAQRVAVCGEGLLGDFQVVSDTLITGTIGAQGSQDCEVVVVGATGATASTTFGCPCGPPPELLSVTPSSGSTAGGTAIDIVGQNLTGDMTATLCGAPLELEFVDATRVRTTTPPAAAAGPCDLTVANSNGSAELLGAFTYVDGPQIDAVTPDCCVAFDSDTAITITGSGFTDDMTVTICGNPLADFQFVSDTEIQGTALPQDCEIRVANDFGEDTATFTCPCSLAPTIASITPSSGSIDGGDEVTIAGTGFTDDMTVTICDALVTRTSFTDTEFQGITPPGAEGSCDVVVTNSNGTATLVDGFVYTTPVLAPIIESISPAISNTTGGGSFTITGQDLAATTQVLFNDVVITDTVFVDDTEIRGTIPPDRGASCVYTVRVQNLTGQGSELIDAFRYGPYIESVSPDGPIHDTGGTTLTITGNCFDDNTIARLCGVGLLPGFVSPTEFSVVTAAGCGSCDVQLVRGQLQHTVADAFTYVSPTISTIAPNVGPPEGGTAVTITGQSFTAETQVLICGNPVENLTLVSPTQITGTTPAGTGVCDVTVFNVGGACAPQTAVQAFTYAAAAVRFLSLGEFNITLEDTDPVRGGSRLAEFLTVTMGYDVTDLDSVDFAQPGSITEAFLSAFDVVAFADLGGRNLNPEEIRAFQNYVESGGGLILLGQMGNSPEDQGGDRTDRNALGALVGIGFSGDLIASPGAYVPYDGGCSSGACNGGDPVAGGDPDDGWEYAGLLDYPQPDHPVTSGITQLVFNWGESLTVQAVAFPLARTRPQDDAFSHLDPQAVTVDGCCDGWIDSTREDEPSQVLVGVAGATLGEGRVVALGDHDLFWNFWFDQFDHAAFLKNTLDWVSQR